MGPLFLGRVLFDGGGRASPGNITPKLEALSERGVGDAPVGGKSDMLSCKRDVD